MMESRRFHGVTSLLLVGIATVLAIIVMFQASLWLGVAYLVVCAIAPQVVIYAYCAKCVSRRFCAHVLPGRAAQRYDRQPGPYTRLELVAMSLGLLALLGLPQPWLWGHTGLFIAYWVLTGIALVQIRIVVCRSCRNIHCPLCPRSMQAGG
jgi:hypothetical protein